MQIYILPEFCISIIMGHVHREGYLKKATNKGGGGSKNLRFRGGTNGFNIISI